MNWLAVRKSTIFFAAMTCYCLAATAQGDSSCGGFSRADRLPPEDYRKPSPRLRVVEDFHFGPNVEALIRPMQVGMSFGSDIDYTLWGYPNHHRALAALVKLGTREKSDMPRGSSFTIDCYFRRALRFAGDDLIARMMYASYLGSKGDKAAALRHVEYVVQNAADGAMTHYNAGLVYLELGAYELAASQAHRAKRLGFDRPTLKESLQRLGKWVAEEETALPAAAPEAASSAAGG